jgi:shikimate dehydrogenase
VITATTSVAVVIGSPVRHSLSPVLHNAAFAALAVDWVYVAHEVSPGGADAAVRAMRTLGLGGMSVTMPHKEQVAACVDRLEPAAAALASVNTVYRDKGRLVGASTDGDGWISSLGECGITVSGARLAVVGAGGAARSIVDAATRAGVERVTVVNRTRSHAEAAAALAGDKGQIGTHADIAAADIVVNTTSIGLGGNEMPFDAAHLRAEQIVADIVYHPRRTALLAAADAAGCRTVDGLGMLIHQAALQQLHWVGAMPDVAVMRAAAEAELARQGR